jgi:hypothetical protein
MALYATAMRLVCAFAAAARDNSSTPTMAVLIFPIIMLPLVKDEAGKETGYWPIS